MRADPPVVGGGVIYDGNPVIMEPGLLLVAPGQQCTRLRHVKPNFLCFLWLLLLLLSP